jgi:hypothetical protein
MGFWLIDGEDLITAWCGVHGEGRLGIDFNGCGLVNWN